MRLTSSTGRRPVSWAIDRASRARPTLVSRFHGYPYLVTRIGRTALRHIAILPADWSRKRLIDLARRQAEANQLETCLCLGPAEAVYLIPGEEPYESTYIPTGIPVIDQLVLAEEFPVTPELAGRLEALRAFNDRGRGTGYLVGDGLEGGRLATASDIARLTASGDAGLPPGLRTCTACGRAHGEYLASRGEGTGDRRPRVIDVLCRCANHNRCAGCGEPLAADRLSAWAWEGASVRYLAAYAGLGHRCPR